MVSHSFGYGLMDASAMVRLARTWQTVPEQQKCEINAPQLDRYVLWGRRRNNLGWHALNAMQYNSVNDRLAG